MSSTLVSFILSPFTLGLSHEFLVSFLFIDTTTERYVHRVLYYDDDPLIFILRQANVWLLLALLFLPQLSYWHYRDSCRIQEVLQAILDKNNMTDLYLICRAIFLVCSWIYRRE
jgi:hypothetical protein